jgi:hypothetical protein
MQYAFSNITKRYITHKEHAIIHYNIGKNPEVSQYFNACPPWYWIMYINA